MATDQSYRLPFFQSFFTYNRGTFLLARAGTIRKTPWVNTVYSLLTYD